MKLPIRPRIKLYSLLISVIAALVRLRRMNPQSFWSFKKDSRQAGMIYYVTLLMNSLVTPFITILFLLLLTFFHVDYGYAEAHSLAPDFTLNNLNGKKVTLSQFRSKAVILNFWSIWCGPCLAEMPSLNKLYLEFKDRGLVVIAVAEDPAEKPVKSYVQEKGIAFTILMDKDKKVYFNYSLFGIPVTFLIDKKGVIAEKFIGERDWCSPEMRRKVSDLLKK
jgi:peroxiredoxin